MANFSGTVVGKGRAFQDAVDALRVNVNLTDIQKTGIMSAFNEAAKALDGLNTHTDKTMTGTWTYLTGANPSLSVSLTT